MKHFRRILALLVLPASLLAQDAQTDTLATVDDPADEAPLVEDAPPPARLVRTWYAIDPLTAILGVAPNLQVERMVGGTFSVAGSAYWGVTSVNRGWEIALRHHFQPGLAGAFIGPFVRGFESEAIIELPENNVDRTFTLRQEGVSAGFHGGRTKVFPSGFSIGWNAGLGWPWVHQEWVGAKPAENDRMIRNFTMVGAVIEAGLWMGFAY